VRTFVVASTTDVMWDDLRVDASTTNLGGGNPASVTTFRNGVRALEFSATVEQSCWFDVQLPHSFHQFTSAYALKPHIHWSPTTTTATGTVIWGIEYTWANPSLDGTSSFGATTQTEGTYTFTTNKQYAHLLTPMGDITITNMGISAVLLGRVYRKAATDTFADTVHAVSIDFHYPLNAPGSIGEFNKGQ
jgi:hypothetical protein